ncbi:hypothetical protein JCM10450v2_005770 [Rhodotorula kratochvilovae]
MFHFTPPTTPRDASGVPTASLPTLQSQYLAAAELAAPTVAPSMSPPPAPAAQSTAPRTPPSARMQARSATRDAIPAANDGHSSESSLDPSLHRPRRQRSSSTPAVSCTTAVESAPPSSAGVFVTAPLYASPQALAPQTPRAAQSFGEVLPATADGARSASAPGPKALPGVKPLDIAAATAVAGAGAGAAALGREDRTTDGQQLFGAAVGVGGGGGALGGRAFGEPQRDDRTPMATGKIVPPPHLPPLVKGLTGLTAYANWDVHSDVEWSLAKVVGPAAVNEVLKDPAAFESFREFTAATNDEHAALLLDLFKDLTAFSQLCTTLRLSSSSISSTYLLKTSPSRLALPITLRGPLLECLYQSASTGHPLLEPLQALHAEAYTQYFQPWMQQKLVEQVVARLGSWKAGLGWTGKAAALNLAGSVGATLSMAATDGLAECYCLTDPHLRDNPITLASEGFAELTGYPLRLIIGRNCRFLQGPGTSPESVKRLHDALAEGRNITSLIFNYRRDGSPFANLLCMAPLKDDKGVVRHFIGGQIDVTGALNAFLTSPSRASHPSPTAHSTLFPHAAAPPLSPSRAPDFTPLVQAQIGRLTTASRVTGITGGEAFRELATGTLAPAPGPGSGPASPALDGASASPRSSATTGQENVRWKGKGLLRALAGGRRSTSTLSIHRRGGSSTEPQGAGADGTGESDATSMGEGEEGKGARARTVEKGTSAEEDGDEGSLAETLMRKHLRAFEQTYSRVALIDRVSGDILYTTPELVEHCGLPASTHHELHNTPFTKHLVPASTARGAALSGAAGDADGEQEEKEQTRRLRRNVRLAIDNGHAWTGLVGLRPEVKKLFGRNKHGDGHARDAVLHLTPLCNKEGSVEMLVAVFG